MNQVHSKAETTLIACGSTNHDTDRPTPNPRFGGESDGKYGGGLKKPGTFMEMAKASSWRVLRIVLPVAFGTWGAGLAGACLWNFYSKMLSGPIAKIQTKYPPP